MAVNLKSTENYGYSLLPLFDVDPSLISKCKKSGVTVASSPGGVTIGYDGTTCASVSIKGQAITIAKQGVMGPASKEAFKAQLESGLNKALILAMKGSNATMAPVSSTMAAFAEHEVKKGSGGFGDPPQTLGSLLKKKKEQESFKNVTAGTFTVDVVGPDEGMQLSQASLLNAKSPYQPVVGTTKGSVYRTFAVSTGLKIAARFKGSTLSMRAEGSDLPSAMGTLGGFKFKQNGPYASVHFEIGNDSALGAKTLGALLSLFGLKYFEKVADPATFVTITKQ